MERFFRWIREHAPELAFLIAGLAAMDAGIDNLLKWTVPAWINTVLGITLPFALQQLIVKKKKEVLDDDDDDDDEERPARIERTNRRRRPVEIQQVEDKASPSENAPDRRIHDDDSWGE